ncbi:hypothetical protein MXC99_10370 [Thauera aromatica]|uniref:hypothetical protein n=1 Tax=Thauera aromatica TaxID=59405 RepID=UPI001FFD2CDD|nr:hypothetical protein [Thauera aromatica]MCK2088574.1 hypothetical protein [Thauera aromatica]
MPETSHPPVCDSAPHALIERVLDGARACPPETFKLASHQKRIDPLFRRLR